MREGSDNPKKANQRRGAKPRQARKAAAAAPGAGERFARAAFDGLSAHIAIVNQDGVIQAVNKNWRDFAAENGPLGGRVCEQANYLEACDAARGDDRAVAQAFAGAIRHVLAGGRKRFEAEYPCHSPEQQRWFIGRVSRLPGKGPPHAIIAHENITARKQAEEALERSKEELRRTAESLAEAQTLSRIGSWRMVLKVGAESWTGSAELHRMWGYPLGYEMGMPAILERFHPDDRAPILEIWDRALRDGQPTEWEHRIVVDGRVKWIHVQITIQRDAQGRPIEVSGTNQDITERKLAQEALRQSEERFRQVAQAAAEFIWEVDATGLYTYASPSVEHTLGYTPEELVGKKHFYDLFIPSERAALKAAALRAFAGRQAFRDFPNANVSKSGKIARLETRGIPILDSEGKLAGYRGTDMDVTARWEAQETLRQSEQKFRRLVESMRDAFVITDMAGLLREFNPAYQELLGYSKEELRRLTYKDLTPERWHEFESQKVRDELMAQGFTDVYEKEYRRKDGTVFPVEMRTFLIRDDTGQPVAMWAIARDLTERKRAEEKEANQQAAIAHLSRVVTMGELAAGIAHEINQPLGASLLYAETCRELLTTGAPNPGQLLPAMSLLIGQLERARTTVTRLREFLRKRPLAFSTVDINRVLTDSAAVLALEFRRAGVGLALELAPRPPLVIADPVLIQQVVINLIMNALQAMTAPGDRPRRLTLGTTIGDDGACTVSVGDTGPGVPPEMIERLFDSFVTSKPQGMGLGLAISRSLIEQHEGRIWHEPAAEGGALFRFTLPAAPPGRKGAPP